MGNIVRISDMVSLALHSMVIIASKNEFINVRGIAELTGFSVNHLSKTLQRLVKAGLVRSVRGPKGGFKLLKPAKDISLMDIYNAIEGPIEIKECPLNSDMCAFKKCIFDGLHTKLNSEFIDYMENKKLSDFSNNI